jgi:CxxC motif-containing protein
MVCIGCPKGCRLEYDTRDGSVKGYSCPQGLAYAKEEATAPKRIVTSTVILKSDSLARLPVKTNKALPKSMMRDAVRLLDGMKIKPPVKTGDTVYQNIFNTQIDFVATKTVLH